MKITNVTSLISRSNSVIKKSAKPFNEINGVDSGVTNLNNLPFYPLINFKAREKRVVPNGDLSAYNDYQPDIAGKRPPEIEEHKFNLSMQAEEYISEENYLEAIRTKIAIAEICRTQGKQRDTYLLEQTTRDLYAALPKYQKKDAKDIIAKYNQDMAKYIDQDVACS